MSEFILVIVTTSNREEAETIAMKLINSGLSPCVNIIGSCSSIYQWKGEVRKDEESLMFIKSSKDLFGKLRAFVQKAHSYDVPEIISIELSDLSPQYAGFLRDFLKDS
jgi:periplasmic divalent cation tolerance protein